MRGDGDVEDVDEDWPPKDERGVGDDDGFDFPLREGSSPSGIAPPEGKSAAAQVSPRDGGVPSRKSPLNFFLGQKTLSTRRWAPEVGRAGHNPPGRAWGCWRALVSCGHQVHPPLVLFAPEIQKYSEKNRVKFSGHSENFYVCIIFYCMGKQKTG